MPSLHFRGVAHPPPARGGKRDNIADLSGAEIHELERDPKRNLGSGAGTDVLVEHDHAARVGRVTSSWEGPRGELRVSGVVSDAAAIAEIKRGNLRGLSLGTGVLQSIDGKALKRDQEEISLCDAPRRSGCYIDHLDGVCVRTVECASKRGGARAATRASPVAAAIPRPISPG